MGRAGARGDRAPGGGEDEPRLRPPAVDDPARGSDPRAAPRADPRSGASRGAARPRRAVLTTVRAAVRSGTDMKRFHAAVYRLVERIPRGQVATYGQIAALVGYPRAAPAVGAAEE